MVNEEPCLVNSSLWPGLVVDHMDELQGDG